MSGFGTGASSLRLAVKDAAHSTCSTVSGQPQTLLSLHLFQVYVGSQHTSTARTGKTSRAKFDTSRAKEESLERILNAALHLFEPVPGRRGAARGASPDRGRSKNMLPY